MNDAEYRIDPEEAVAAAIDAAEEVFEQVAPVKPRLLVENCNPDLTVAALRDILAEVGGLYDRGVPVQLAFEVYMRVVADLLPKEANINVEAGEAFVELWKKISDGLGDELADHLDEEPSVVLN